MFTQVSFVVQALQPIKIAVEALCRRDANFISAEATIKFLLDEIQNYLPSGSEYIHQIIEAINQRSIQERYIEASVITAYLHNPLAKLEKKGVVKAFCLRLLSRLDKNEVVERNTVDEIDTIISNSDLEVNDTVTLPVAMKLQLAIEASLKIPRGITIS